MNKHPITLLTAAGTPERRTAHRRRGDIAGSHARRLCERRQIDQPEYRQRKQRAAIRRSRLENEQHQKITSPLVVLPPLQRVEPSERSVVRITKTPEADRLPQDRESVFYFNLREIPPKSTKTNVMQLALQTQIKLFYRPKAIVAPRQVWQEKLVFRKAAAPSPSTTRRRFTSP